MDMPPSREECKQIGQAVYKRFYHDKTADLAARPHFEWARTQVLGGPDAPTRLWKCPECG